MPKIFGDKIGISAATPGGSSGTWGTEYGAAFTSIDEHLYAAREDRNLVITGGGKISHPTAGNLAWTADFEVHNAITAYKNTIDTGAIGNLASANQVLYVQIERKPASDNDITTATVASAGSLPNGTTDADQGTLVLAYRTADGTLYLPWAGKELLVGDHWSIGAGQTWLERLASSRKPSYESVGSTTDIDVPASASAPAAVFINGKLYVNTSDVTCDMSASGRNGLDTGSVAADTPYYLYAIPAVSGRGFDVVASATAPTTGPTGFSSWSYIGSFASLEASTTIEDFKASSGIINFAGSINSSHIQSDTTPIAETYNNMPTTVKSIWAWVAVRGSSGDGISGDASGKSGGGSGTHSLRQRTYNASDEYNYNFGWIAIFTAQTVYLETQNATTDIDCRILGWREDPMEYQ